MHADFKERRRTPRIDLAQVVRIRPLDPGFPSEYCTTFNVSKEGLYFTTTAGHYALGMRVYVTRDFQPGSPMGHSVTGAVVRIDAIEGGKWGVAVHIFSGAPPAS
jgi:hypothetical protein